MIKDDKIHEPEGIYFRAHPLGDWALNKSKSTLHTPQSALQSAHQTLCFYNPQCTLYTLHSIYTPHSIPHTLHSTLHDPHSALHTPHSRVYTAHFTLQTSGSTHPTLHFTLSPLRTPHFTLHTPHSTLYTPHSTLYTVLHFLQSTLYTSHSTLDTAHFTLYTLHSTLNTLQHALLCTLDMLHYVHLIQYSILYMTHYTPHSVPHKLDALHSTLSTLHAPHLTLHTLHSTRFAAFAAGTARRELETDSRQIPHKVTLHTSNTTSFAAYAIVTAVQWGVELESRDNFTPYSHQCHACHRKWHVTPQIFTDQSPFWLHGLLLALALTNQVVIEVYLRSTPSTTKHSLNNKEMLSIIYDIDVYTYNYL